MRDTCGAGFGVAKKDRAMGYGITSSLLACQRGKVSGSPIGGLFPSEVIVTSAFPKGSAKVLEIVPPLWTKGLLPQQAPVKGGPYRIYHRIGWS